MKGGFIPFGSKAYFADISAASPSLGTVYLIDDMAEGLHFVAVVLGQAGYRTELHSSLAEFAPEFSNHNAAAILLDVRLGQEDATDVLMFLRHTGCSVPIYLISGDPAALNTAKRFAEEIGLSIAELIPKPFTGRQILDRLEQKSSGLREVFNQVDVAEALEKGWIYPVLQPKLDLASGKIRSAELLSRMTHPDFGVVPPQRFISHMSVDQSQMLFMSNVAYARRHFAFDAHRGNDFPISINVDATNLVSIREKIREVASDCPSFYRNLIFEITEEEVGKISDEQLKVLYKLILDGARLSIDDFGAGHSNFARLSRLPFNEIKIDRSIVHNCSASQHRGIIIKSIIGMARDLNARVVAEGVEMIEDLRFLDEARCDEVQGYLVGRPMKLERFNDFVRDFNGRGFRENDVSMGVPVVMDAHVDRPQPS